MRVLLRTQLCLLLNFVGLCGVILFILAVADYKELFAFGPSANLIILTVRIDTWVKYVGLVAASCIFKMLEVFVNDIGSPNLGFSVYNPTTTVVYGFTRLQLQVLTNCMWMVNSLTYVFQVTIIVSRLDIALFSVVTGELTSACVVGYLLSNKSRFVPNFDTKEDEDNNGDDEDSLQLEEVLVIQ